MECEQLVDTESMKRYEVMLDVTNLVGLRLPPGIEKYDRMHSAILSEYDREHDTEEEVDEVPEAIEKVGPPLALDSVDIEESGRPRSVNVVVKLSNKEEEFMEELTVFSILSELARSQGIIDKALELEMRSNLRVRRIPEDVLDEISSRVTGELEKRGFRIIEYQ